MFSNLYASTLAWVKEPFQQPMNIVQVFLAVGLVLIAIVLWGRILAHLSEG